MNVKYIDSHCHLQFKQYSQDREKIIAQMRNEGVAGIVVGTDLKTSKEAVELSEKYEHLYTSVGMHPTEAVNGQFNTEEYRVLAAHPKVVAIGECGLEYFHLEASEEIKHTQKELLQKHISLATELDKPLIIHVRSNKGSNDAYQDLIAILKEAKISYPKLRGDIHFFAGSLAEAEEFFALDFTISFTAVITFSQYYDEIIKKVPLANILSETDAPYVAPASRRGERNDPLAVIEVVRQIAQIRDEDFETIRASLLANARCMFNLAEGKI